MLTKIGMKAHCRESQINNKKKGSVDSARVYAGTINVTSEHSSRCFKLKRSAPELDSSGFIIL